MTTPGPGLTYVRGGRELEELRAALVAARAANSPVGMDFETTGPVIVHPKNKRKASPDFPRHRLVGIGLAVGGRRWYAPVAHTEGNNLDAAAVDRLLYGLAHQPLRLWAHNWACELQLLRNHLACRWCGAQLGHWPLGPEGCPAADGHLLPDEPPNMMDSMVVAWMAGVGLKADGAKGLALKALMAEYFGVRRPGFREVVGERKVEDVPAAELGPYCAADAADAVTLGEWCWLKLGDGERVDYERHRKTTSIISMSMNGTSAMWLTW